MSERDKDAPGAFWSEALRGLADIRSKLMAGWFGRDPDSPRAGDLGWTLGDKDASRDLDPGESLLDRLYRSHPEEFVSQPGRDTSPSVVSGWNLLEASSRDRDGPDLER